MRSIGFTATVMALAAMFASPAQAKPVTDCPLRNAPFSLQSPLLDVLLSPAAKAVVEKAVGKPMSATAPYLSDTRVPAFAALLTMETAGRFAGIGEAALPALDAALRRLPVTGADRVARCQRYDNDVPHFKLAPGKPHLLLFEKITGFKDTPSVDAARAAFLAMAQRNGWDIVVTQSGGAINPRTLAQFDAVIWNNVSGDVLTLSQRAALQRYMARGGGFMAVHGAGGDLDNFWDWYADTLIGARFLMHPIDPQFQEARIVVDRSHPLAGTLPAEWRMTDEWYSFKANPRKAGAKVLLTLDESTYSPVGPMGVDLRMGSNHPLAWSNCIGRGRMFYSAIGHRPETYADPNNVTMMETALKWVATAKQACPEQK